MKTSSWLLALLLAFPAARSFADGDEPKPKPPEEKPSPPPEAPTPAPTDKPGDKPAGSPEAKPEEKPAEPAAAPTAEPAAPPSVKQAWKDAEEATKKLGREGPMKMKETVTAYLKGFDDEKRTAEGEDRYWLGRMRVLAGFPDAGVPLFGAVMHDRDMPALLRDDARLAFAESVGRRWFAKEAGEDPSKDAIASLLPEAMAAVEAVASDEKVTARGSARMQLAGAIEKSGKADEAIAWRMRAAVDSPGLSLSVARNVMGDLLESTHSIDGYPAVRKGGKAVVTMLAQLYESFVASSAKRGNPVPPPTVEAVRKGFASAALPLEMLGTPAPEWTLVHSFQGGKSLGDFKGKVVLIDFWATWCPWCIKSFPAIRDLRKAYGDKGFVVVGVTEPANNVWEARYSLDDDMKAKMEAEKEAAKNGTPPPAALQLKKDPTEEDKRAFRAQEIETIAKFLKNHEVDWDIVMIEEKQASARYALGGWPHGVILDKKGRVRAMHSGALLRDQPKSVEETKKIIEDLLAEPD